MNTRTIRRPDLTDEERAKRMRAIKEAAIELIIATDKAKACKAAYIGEENG